MLIQEADKILLVGKDIVSILICKDTSMEGQPEMTYEFTFDQQKNLGPEERSSLIRSFKNYDTNKDGVMDAKEFKNIMIDLGYRKITDEEV